MSTNTLVRPKNVDDGILLSNDLEGLKAYKKRKEKFRKIDDIDTLEKRITALESTVENLVKLINNNRTFLFGENN